MDGNYGLQLQFGPRPELIDERQITHLICARLKYDLYDFFRAVWGLLPALFLVKKAPKHPLKKSNVDHILSTVCILGALQRQVVLQGVFVKLGDFINLKVFLWNS